MNTKHPLGDKAHIYEIQNQKPRVSKTEHDMGFSPQHVKDALDTALHERSHRIEEEITRGFEAIRDYPKSVTFFGSARFTEENEFYQKAQELAGRLCEMGFAVITGGGPGIMEAGNRGSKNACGYGVGFNIELPHEQNINAHATHGVNFHYFFTRKVALSFSAEAYIYFPGGFGTLDELFEILTLVQTQKIPRVPIICVGSDFWQPLDTFIRGALLQEYNTISESDVHLYTITDDIEKILDIVDKAPLRNEYDM